MSAVLEVQGLTVRYGGVTAVENVDLTVEAGEIVGLIGPNGAGKTTFIDAVSGFTKCSGTVRLAGSELAGRAPHQRALRGLSRTWQLSELFDDLTVEENVSVAAIRPRGWDTLRSVLSGRDRPTPGTERALERVGILGLADRPASRLTEGERKLVGVARTLAAGPEVVLLDEPAAGLDTNESAKFGATLSELAADGTGLLLVDHDMGLVMSVCDRIVVLDFGRVIAVGTPGEVRDNPEVVRAYLGTTAENKEI